MRKVDELFARYGESHRHPANEAIHWICVPLITWSVLAALWAAAPVVAYIGIGLAVAFYAWLSMQIAVGMLVVFALMVYPDAARFESRHRRWVVFVLAWIGQFVGHAIEGRKPSFLEDVKFLLVGPAWLLHSSTAARGYPIDRGGDARAGVSG
jgi:uncharacterized membrane protein YGL010W